MPIITIFSASYCGENEISTKLAKKLGYDLIAEKLIDATAEQFHVSTQKIRDTVTGHIPFLNNITHEREKNIAYLKSILAQLVSKDNVIYHGFASHLLPKNITHILRVCILANNEYRIKNAMNEENISEQNAKRKIKKDDEKRFKWVHDIYHLSPWDESLYDIIIPIHTSSIDQAVSLISENSAKKALATTQESQKALDDFLLCTAVNVPLVENGYDVNIDNDDGHIRISLKEYVIRFEHMKEKIINIVSAITGVRNVEVIMGLDAKVPSRYDELEPPPRFLLVDDEKEFVQTLSDRLQTRDLDSSIAYDGEEALSSIEKDEPDVMVLDLKMPGVNGMDVLRKVKKERPHVEVIILTGHGSEKDKALAMELGAFAYLEKPVDIDILTKTMKDAYSKINKGKKDKKS
jgi:ActR/RegA family two-component response regulator/cytidylate kinase